MAGVNKSSIVVWFTPCWTWVNLAGSRLSPYSWLINSFFELEKKGSRCPCHSRRLQGVGHGHVIGNIFPCAPMRDQNITGPSIATRQQKPFLFTWAEGGGRCCVKDCVTESVVAADPFPLVPTEMSLWVSPNFVHSEVQCHTHTTVRTGLTPTPTNLYYYWEL